MDAKTRDCVEYTIDIKQLKDAKGIIEGTIKKQKHKHFNIKYNTTLRFTSIVLYFTERKYMSKVIKNKG